MSVKDNYPNLRPSLALNFAQTKTLDPRITFSRASTGTYYDGVTHAKAEENLLTYSQEFDDTDWTKDATTVTANDTTAPDGTLTADAVFETAVTTNFTIYQSNTAANTEYAISVFVKANNRDKLVIRGSYVAGTNWISAEFDLTAETATLLAGSGNTGTNTSATITDAGNGWYRCGYIFTPASGHVSTTTRFCISDGTTPNASSGIPVYAGDVTKGLYFWGAQLEERSSVTAYTATTTQPITNYIPVLQSAAAGEARFDHDPVTGESKGLLIEEQRTNLVTYSEDYSTGQWSNKDVTLTTGQASPDGQNSATLVTSSTTAISNGLNLTGFLGTTGLTYSCFAKKGSTNWLLINNVSGVEAYFDLDNGVKGTTIGCVSEIQDVGNGWYRCSLYLAGAFGGNGRLVVSDSDNTANTASGNSVFIWGVQLEAGAFPTSYIPTSGSQATRNADSASMTGTNFSEWFRQDEGTLYVETGDVFVSDRRSFTLSDSTVNNQLLCRVNLAASSFYSFEVYTSAAYQARLNQNVDSQGKIACSFSTNDFATSSNGGNVAVDTNGLIANYTQMFIGSTYNGSSEILNSTIKKLTYYPARLTNAQLQALTEG